MLPVVRTISVLVRLIPVTLALRRDRKRWSRGAKGNYQRNARRALKTFIDLGPIYIKLGQWLSSRADILPQPYIEELAKLQDDVPATSFDKVKPIIEKELGPISEMFESVETTPLSGASLGQVYKARMDGEDVVIKVRRPGVEKLVKTDIAVLKKILPAGLAFVDPNLRFSAKAILAQFIESLGEEMDYVQEAENLKTIKASMKDYPNVIIPSIYEDHSSERVLTMEYVPGIKVTDLESLEEVGVDRTRLVTEIHRVFFTMLLRHPIFHADPHPGNISVTSDGRLILYDFGMVGRLDRETRLRLIRLYLALVERDPPRTINAMDELGMLAPGYNRAVMEKAIRMTVEAMHGRKPDEMEVRGLMELANRTMNRFPFLLPKNLALYMRMASIIEGIYKTHKVDFRFVAVLRDILEQEHLARDGYIEELKHVFRQLLTSAEAAISLAPELRRFLEEHDSRKPRRSLLGGSIFSSTVFFGSVLVYISGYSEGLIGMAISLIIMWLFARRR